MPWSGSKRDTGATNEHHRLPASAPQFRIHRRPTLVAAWLGAFVALDRWVSGHVDQR
jgi:hypothetical protein